MYKIVNESSDEVLGTIGIWKIDWKGPQTYEMGWFVLPEHQGKGVAIEAALLIITQAHSDPDVRYVHAYPTVSNAASNAIARRSAWRIWVNLKMKVLLAYYAAKIGESTFLLTTPISKMLAHKGFY
jgi:RimJ/RimL family protein N-acetyltransferase